MNNFTKYPHLFAPLKIKKTLFKNRIEVPPMGINLGRSDGYITTEYYLWVKRLARSGAGIITVSDAAIDYDLSGGGIAGPRLDSDDKIPGLSRLTDEIHRYGAIASIEGTHYGAVANLCLLKPLGSIPISSSKQYRVVNGKKEVIAEEMTQEMINEVIDKYVNSVRIAKAAGFDMYMLHGAHGQLPAQFLSPFFNHRTDKYGGSLENRMRFPLELLRAIREECGSDFLIEYRISGDELDEEGIHYKDTLRFLKEAEQYIDIVHFSVGIDPERHGRRFSPSYIEPHNVNLIFAEQAKKVLSIPVAVVGGISYHEDAEKMIREGKTDFVVMGRATIADEMGHKKAEMGLEEDIRPCMRCGNCGRVSRAGGLKTVLCSVNPVAGRELEYGTIYPAVKKKKVMIVGGGPAGMQAALTAVERGHEVVLYEKAGRLGGMLHTASSLSFKEDMRKYVNYMIHKTKECGADIILNTSVDKSHIQKENPDTLILAVGATPFIPNIKGGNHSHVVWAGDLDNGNASAGENVMVIGAGLTGLECAIALAGEGKNVTIADSLPLNRWCMDAGANTMISLEAKLKQYDVNLRPEVNINSIETDKVIISDKNGKQMELPVDTIAMATGMRSLEVTVNKLNGIIRETYIVGDCKKAGNILNAVHNGFQAAVDL